MMYPTRRLGALGQDDEFSGPLVDPGASEASPGVIPASGNGGGGITWNIGDTITQIIRGITGGGSIHAQVPGPQGFPGSSGCPWNQCPTQAGPVILCQPCASPAAAVPTTVGTTVTSLTQSPWFFPVVILAVVYFATRKR